MGSEQKIPTPDDEVKTPPLSGEPKKSRIFKRPFKILAGLIIVAVIVFGVIKYFQDRSSNLANACSGKAQSTLMNQAASSLSVTQVSRLGGFVNKIKQLPSYQKDPSCMFVLTMYNVNMFNIAEAQASLKLFNQDYHGQNLTPNLTRLVSVPTLRASVEQMSQILKQDNQNSTGLSPRPLKQ